MDNENVENPSTNVEDTTTTNVSNKIEFSPEQQAKLNSLLKEEREKIFSKLGVANLEEGREKLAKASKVDEYELKFKEFESKLANTKKLASDNAMLTHNIDEENREIVEMYFKGKGEDLTSENLAKLFEEKPKLKEQWEKKTTIPSITLGNKSTKEPELSGYEQFKKNANIKY